MPDIPESAGEAAVRAAVRFALEHRASQNRKLLADIGKNTIMASLFFGLYAITKKRESRPKRRFRERTISMKEVQSRFSWTTDAVPRDIAWEAAFNPQERSGAAVTSYRIGNRKKTVQEAFVDRFRSR
ncbi:MAG: hypothetical protein JO026_01330 [Patescibacteria group bacterium]|nr:hypothetical protein [Patescibacteria group bacterium]